SRSFAAGSRSRRRRSRSVLNAFRHHGVLRPASVSARTRVFACSTPFGITEFCGMENGRSHGGYLVLNAFRHHGVLRIGCGESSTAVITSAQRLSASRSFAAWLPATLAKGPEVCSTPFG